MRYAVSRAEPQAVAVYRTIHRTSSFLMDWVEKSFVPTSLTERQMALSDGPSQTWFGWLHNEEQTSALFGEFLGY